MKKLWTDPKVIQRKDRRRAKIERRRRRVARGRTKHLRQVPFNKLFARNGGRRNRIIAPRIFSLVENESETQVFFKNLSYYLAFAPGVYLEMRDVVRLSPDAIMYLLAVIDVYAQLGQVDIVGNTPRDRRAAALLADSGFYDYVRSSVDDKHALPDVQNQVLKIASGEYADASTAGAAIAWACERLDLDYECEAASTSYETLIECLSNVTGHAYRHPDNNPVKQLWWLAAIYDERTKDVIFTVLDMGSGIPKTLALDWPQRVKQLLRIGSASEVLLIQRALEGHFPSQTGLPHRGKGLPAIKAAMDDGLLSGLILVSGRGYLNYGTGKTTHFPSPFTGTLYSWRLSSNNDAQ